MFCERTKRNCFAESDLTFLFTISDIISKSQNINKDLELVLANLCKFLNAQYSMITIINRNVATIEISAAYGLTDEEKHRGVYKIGEGVIGEVVRTKKAKIIADVSKDPHFLNKTGIATDLVHNTAFL